MRIALATSVLVLAACGDNIEVAPDAVDNARCEPATPSPMPIAGPFADPLALPLPASCVTGGLKDLPGRWFVRDPMRSFTFEYPKFDGTCSSGFRRANWRDEDDTDLADDNAAYETWSDGTRIYIRSLYRFEFREMTYEFANVQALCMLPDGTLAGVDGNFDTDVGERFTNVIGTRFAPKDSGAMGLTLIGEVATGTSVWPIYAYNVAIDGTHAYVAGPVGLDVVDFSTPSAPVAVGHLDGQFNDVKLARGATDLIAYAAPLNNDPTSIINVTDPTAPTAVGQIATYSHSLFITPTTPPKLYLGDYTGQVPVYDVTNPLTPIRLGQVAIPGDDQEGIHDIHVSGDRVYAFKTTQGVVAVDVAAGIANPTPLGALDTSYSHAGWAGTAGGRQILIHGDEGMTPDGGAFLRVLDADTTSATFMQEIGRFATRAEVGIHNMQLVGDRAYVAYYQDGVRVIDLSDPTQPREIAHYNTWNEPTAGGGAFEGAVGISVIGDYIYVADTDRGFLILRDDTN